MRILFFFLLVSSFLNSQTIPSERLGNWEGAGAQMSDYSDFQVMNVADFGFTGDSSQVISNELNDLIDEAGDNSVVFYFPEGTYVFDTQIKLTSNKILKGDSTAVSELRFINFDNGNLIEVFGQRLTDTFNVKNIPQKGSFRVNLDRDHNFEPGDLIYLFQDDSDKVFSNWALNSTGHLSTIKSVSGRKLFLETPINQNFESGRKPMIYQIQPIENVFINCLKIKATEPGTGQFSNIHFRYVRNCGVSGIESYNCEFAHVRISQSLQISVTGSYFQDGFAYGNGGKAYGVVMEYGTTRSLAENNIFNHLRHSILLQSGANNNVGGYNYSKNPHWRGVSLPFDAAGELVYHGNYTFANLFEGNIVQNMVSDDSHSANGPYNTFFRNRTEGYGFTNGLAPPSDSQNLVGNVIVQSPNPFIPAIFNTPGEGHFLYGNFYQGAIRPAGTADLPETSLYFTEEPYFLAEYPDWDYLGTPDGVGNFFNPAKIRSEIYDSKTYCGWEGFPGDTSTSVENLIIQRFSIFPNPSFSGLLEIGDTEITGFTVYNSVGQPVFYSENPQPVMDFGFLPKGVYFLKFNLLGQDHIEKWIRG